MDVTNPRLTAVLIVVALLFVLFNDTARKYVGFLIVLSLAFALGWFWPKPAQAGITQAQSPPCVSSH